MILSLLNQIAIYPFANLLAFFIWLVPGHYAWIAIVLLTLLVRLILLVPSRKAAQVAVRGLI